MTCLFGKLLRKILRKTSLTRGCLFGAEEKPAGHTCFNAVKLAREHKKSRNWSRSHHVSKKKKMGNRRIRPRSGRKSGAPKAPEPSSVGLGFRVRVSVRASHGQNTSCVGIFAYLLKNSSFGVAWDYDKRHLRCSMPPICEFLRSQF